MRRVISVVVVLVTLVALCGTVYAVKRAWGAKLWLTDGSGGGPAGSVLLGSIPGSNGLHVQVFVHNISGPATGVHFHGPAGQNVITLCGTPAPSAFGACPALNSNGQLDFSGIIAGAGVLQPGITIAQFNSWLNDEQLSADVHTAASDPSAESRGQLVQIFPQ